MALCGWPIVLIVNRLVVRAMSDEAFELSTVPPALPAEADYDAICTAVMATARGRWFLHEYAKRNRNADTRVCWPPSPT